ncbi:cobalt-precorrin-6A reductase [Propionimicrobium lymphophilum]|uniref:cobalt-precorrin-6A reductase n=1 Tax=Propionimicrobium lymphophilum TaxID=33012 RepID=UPI0023F0C764|nr:cobalt-precorrin-6A reductase [Propionimicrobium lymphophilum]MDK7710516.1 cobalt-precorrin-6A reductase [Propionimicrobium lymphophilum]MDK7734462.1 cobalt-precorrin-6A reductase [Propionimicrobium lymphophilum]
MKILLLGGTADSRSLAAQLRLLPETEVIESVAGRTKAAKGDRVGGFGGAEGLADYLRDEHISVIVDATHPFAETMTKNAAAAGAETGVPVIRYSRPGWLARPDAMGWTWVSSHEEAAREAAKIDGVVLLTVGRQPVKFYHDVPRALARVAEWRGDPIPDGWRVLARRGPFSLDDELELMKTENVRAIVSKDSGGDATAAKLDAAAKLNIPVIMVARPAPPEGVTVCDNFDEIQKLILLAKRV